LLVAAAALILTLVGWRPAPAPAPPPALLLPVPPLERLRLVELRRLARAAGLPRQLARSGRRVELLQALAVVPPPSAAYIPNPRLRLPRLRGVAMCTKLWGQRHPPLSNAKDCEIGAPAIQI
jgi:hypothetical protein